MTFIKKAAVLALATASFAFLPATLAVPGTVLFPPKTLEVTRQPAEKFPEVPADLQAGCQFNRQKILDLLPKHSKEWYVVPKWLAGEFAYGQMTFDYEKDFATGKKSHPGKIIPAANAGRHRGMFVDKKGNIWQQVKSGAIGSSNPGDKSYNRFDDATMGVMFSPTEYVEMSESIEFIVDDNSKIQTVMRMERVRSFIWTKEKNLVSAYIDEVHFDQQGNPIVEEKTEGCVKKVHDFEPMTEANERNKGDYSEALKSLRAYMQHEGKATDAP